MTGDLRGARAGLERQATELERRRRYMEIVLGNIGAGVVSVDSERRVSTINPSAQRYLGIPAGSDLLGQKLAAVANRPELLEVIEELSSQLRPRPLGPGRDRG
jgi:two-component system nitrogen regulation sensor histidine kinase NtrY